MHYHINMHSFWLMSLIWMMNMIHLVDPMILMFRYLNMSV